GPVPGGVPEWLKGTGCKPVGYAYVGSNPASPIPAWPQELAGRRSAALFDDAALMRPAAQLVAGRELQLAQHGADVGLDRLDRDIEPCRDLLVEVAAGYVLQDLALARRQEIEFRIDLRGRHRAGEGVKHEAGKPGRKDGVAFPDPP